MHVEFVEVVEGVGEGGDRAGDCFGDAVVEGEGARGLVACCEGDVLQLAQVICYLFCFVNLETGKIGDVQESEAHTCSPSLYVGFWLAIAFERDERSVRSDSHCPIEARYWDLFSKAVSHPAVATGPFRDCGCRPKRACEGEQCRGRGEPCH